MSNFSFSHNVFYPFAELSAIFIKFENVVCKLLEEYKICRLEKGYICSIPKFKPKALSNNHHALSTPGNKTFKIIMEKAKKNAGQLYFLHFPHNYKFFWSFYDEF